MYYANGSTEMVEKEVEQGVQRRNTVRTML